MAYPEIVIDRAKLTHNSKVICSKAREQGIQISGVTKACLADEHVARAMVAGGVAELADSRLENLEKLKALDLGVPLTLLRIPGLSQVRGTVELADTSLNSQYEAISALGAEARRLGKIHSIILMVDLGDLREGVLPKELLPLAREVTRIKGVKLRGIGVNLACYGGVIPTGDNLSQLAELAGKLGQAAGKPLEVISGGNSSSLGMLFRGEVPKGITNLRIGEGILLGRETINREPVEDCYQDAFTLRAEVVEVHVKPSLPKGIISQDAFGRVPVFEDKGPMVRAIVAIGRQDVPAEGVYPLDRKLRILGASSDHLLMDASKKPGITVGDIVSFGLTYGGLLGAMTSPFVSKRVKY